MNEAFQVHRLTVEGLEKADEMAHRFDDLLEYLSPIVGEGRELAIVRTKLEEACFFAKKGMARRNAVVR